MDGCCGGGGGGRLSLWRTRIWLGKRRTVAVRKEEEILAVREEEEDGWLLLGRDVSALKRLGRVPGGCILSREGIVSFLGRVPGGYRILSRKGTGRVYPSSEGSEGYRRVPYPFSEGYREGVPFLRRVGRVLGGYRILSRKGRKGTGRVHPSSEWSEGYREGTVSFLGRVGRVAGGCTLPRKGRKGIGGYRILSRKDRKGTGRVPYPFSEGSERYRDGTVSFLGRVQGGCTLPRKGLKGTGRVPYLFLEG